MTHDDKHAGISEDQTHNLCKKMDSPVNVISTEKLRSLMLVAVMPAVGAAQREETRSMFRNLVEEIIGYNFATGYCAATEGMKNSAFSFVEDVSAETIRRGVRDETLNQSFNYSSRSRTFMQVLL